MKSVFHLWPAVNPMYQTCILEWIIFDEAAIPFFCVNFMHVYAVHNVTDTVRVLPTCPEGFYSRATVTLSSNRWRYEVKLWWNIFDLIHALVNLLSRQKLVWKIIYIHSFIKYTCLTACICKFPVTQSDGCNSFRTVTHRVTKLKWWFPEHGSGLHSRGWSGKFQHLLEFVPHRFKSVLQAKAGPTVGNKTTASVGPEGNKIC